MISYLQLPIISTVTDVDIKDNIGWTIVALVLVNISLNFGSLLIDVIFFIISKVKSVRNRRNLQNKTKKDHY